MTAADFLVPLLAFVIAILLLIVGVLFGMAMRDRAEDERQRSQRDRTRGDR